MLRLGWGGANVMFYCTIAINIHTSCYVWGGVGWQIEVKGNAPRGLIAPGWRWHRIMWNTVWNGVEDTNDTRLNTSTWPCLDKPQKLRINFSHWNMYLAVHPNRVCGFVRPNWKWTNPTYPILTLYWIHWGELTHKHDSGEPPSTIPFIEVWNLPVILLAPLTPWKLYIYVVLAINPIVVLVINCYQLFSTNFASRNQLFSGCES